MLRVLVTGSEGYIGTVLTPILRRAGHDVVGLDSCLFKGCDFGSNEPNPDILVKDIRDVGRDDLEGFDSVVHLAAISNDPLGDLNPATTMEINHEATVMLARVARAAGVERFVFASSCSLYGATPGEMIDESAGFNPVTPYGESKIRSELDLGQLASRSFSPTYLRNATVYGPSPRFRGDLVVNNLTGFAFTTGKVYLKSDGSSWRPLIHVEDVCRAALAVLEADREIIHNEAFNVGAATENYQIRQVAEMVSDAVPGSEITIAEQAFDDPRDYRVGGDKLSAAIPDATPRWDLREGIQQLAESFAEHGLTLEDLEGERFMRIRRVQALLEAGEIDEQLRHRQPVQR